MSTHINGEQDCTQPPTTAGQHPRVSPKCLPGHSSPLGLFADREKWKPFSWGVAHGKDILGLLQGLKGDRRKAWGALGFRGRSSQGCPGPPPGREAVLGNRITHSLRPRLKGVSSSCPGGQGRQEQDCLDSQYPEQLQSSSQTLDWLSNCQSGSQTEIFPPFPQL